MFSLSFSVQTAKTCFSQYVQGYTYECTPNRKGALMMSDSNLTNPLTAFFHDEFPEQYQEPPGLQKNMKPVPDCGEKATKDQVN